MPDYVSVGTTGPQPLPPGEWTTVVWDREYADAAGQHVDEGGPSILNGPARYALTVGLALRGLPAGTRGQIRSVEVDAADTANFASGPVQEFTAASGESALLYSVPADTIGAGWRLRVQVVQHGTTAGTVAGTAKLLFWR
ncbi:hypothetical protein [Actinomadura hibisca]|uniref:hypothetical protein n=1 Tax=Actinomadura hibisca TaxID=68565 RepID=UPI000834ECD1|nr:hypothetical protein [Actinomadura hibisca]